MRTRGAWLWRLAFIAMGAASACRREEANVYPAAPCFSTIPTLDTLHALTFDPVFGAADTQFVDFVNRQLGQGKLRGSIEPQTSAWSGTVYAALKRKQGCIIARIGTEQRVPDKPFFGATHAYWWIQGDPDSATGKSVFIPDDSTITQRYITDVRFTKHRGHHWTQSISKFKPGSLYGWSVCGDMCCESQF